jgi:hypothetical protein
MRDAPHSSAFNGYILLRILQSVYVAWGGIIFAGIIVYESLRVCDCLPEGDSPKCHVDDSEDDTSSRCKKLWGIMSPESLLVVIATAAAVVLALTMAFVGTIMDSTPHRKGITAVCVFVSVIFTFVCVCIAWPSSTTIIISAISLFIITLAKEVFALALESYAPELSSKNSEISTAITAGNMWLYAGLLINLIIMVVISVIVGGREYSFVVTAFSGFYVTALAYYVFVNLPSVPPSRTHPPDQSVFQITVTQVTKVVHSVATEHPDIGLVYLANMFCDPALNAIFVVAIQVLVGSYNFTSSEIPIIFIFSVIGTLPGVLCSRWAAESSLWDRVEALMGTGESDVSQADDKPTEVQSEVAPSDEDAASEVMATESRRESDAALIHADVSYVEMTSPNLYKHPGRVKILWIAGLIFVSLVTLSAPFILKPCAMGNAIVMGFLWGFCMTFCWNSSTMLRAVLVSILVMCA